MNKETKSKCCGASVLCYSSLPDFPKCSKCGEPFIPQADTPVTPIEEKKCDCKCMLCDDANYGVVGVSHCPHPIEPSVERYVTIQPPSYLNVSIAEYMVMKEQGILMKVKEIEEEIKAAEEKAKEGIIQDVLELCRYNGEIQSVDILKYAKVNGISLQAK